MPPASTPRPPFSSRQSMRVWPSTRSAGAPLRRGISSQIEHAAVAGIARRSAARRRWRRRSTSSAYRRRRSPPRLAQRRRRNPPGRARHRPAGCSSAAGRARSARDGSRRPPPRAHPGSRATPVGTLRVAAPSSPLALRPSRKKSGWPMRRSAGVWSACGRLRQISRRWWPVSADEQRSLRARKRRAARAEHGLGRGRNRRREGAIVRDATPAPTAAPPGRAAAPARRQCPGNCASRRLGEGTQRDAHG